MQLSALYTILKDLNQEQILQIMLLKTTKYSAWCREYFINTYLYAGPFVKHFYHKCRRTTTGMFLESQSKTPLQNKDWKERFEVKIEKHYVIFIKAEHQKAAFCCCPSPWPSALHWAVIKGTQNRFNTRTHNNIAMPSVCLFKGKNQSTQGMVSPLQFQLYFSVLKLF